MLIIGSTTLVAVSYWEPRMLPMAVCYLVLAGLGQAVTLRQIRARLDRELRTNVALRVEDCERDVGVEERADPPGSANPATCALDKLVLRLLELLGAHWGGAHAVDPLIPDEVRGVATVGQDQHPLRGGGCLGARRRGTQL